VAYCPQCAAELTEDASTCLKCGAVLNTEGGWRPVQAKPKAHTTSWIKIAAWLAGIAVGWLLVVFGAWALFENVYVSYLLITGQLVPGEPYTIDDLAPTIAQALTATLIACAILAIGFVVIRIAERYKNKTNEAPGA
jgi:hypothetical protein